MSRCAVLLVGLAVLAPAVRPQVALEELVASMEAVAAPGGAPVAGDWVLTGTMTSQGQTFEQTISVRREPFAYREDVRWVPVAPGAAPPPGIPRQATYLSDGVLSWNLPDELGPAAPLSGWTGAAVLDNALLFRLLLDPRGALAAAGAPPRVVTEVARPRDPGVESVLLEWPHGTSWLTNVERASGRVQNLHDGTHATGRWYVLREWRDFGGAPFPAVYEAGVGGLSASTVRHASLVRDEALPPETFPASPVPRLGAVEEVADLTLAHQPVPGTLAVIVPGCQLGGGRGIVQDIWSVIDTGAIGLFADPRMTGPLEMPRVGRGHSIGLFGGGDTDSVWVDILWLGRHPVLQLAADTAPLPPQMHLPPDRAVGVIFGGPRLMALSPILDLRDRRLLLRGPGADGRVRPLSDVAGRPALTLPLGRGDRGTLQVEWSLGGAGATAVLDTGLAYTARLSRADMRRLGLPLDDAEWRRRGAHEQTITGVHGHETTELLVRLDQDLRFGPVTLQRPAVVLMGEAMEGAERAIDVTILGMGALSAFEMIGFDRGRVLELVAPAHLLEPGPEPRVVVPPPEDPLGFELKSGDRGVTSRPHGLPHVVGVKPGGAAERAGMRDGDFLAEVDGMACDGVAPMDLWDRLRLRGRDELRLALLREGERVEVVIGGGGPEAGAR